MKQTKIFYWAPFINKVATVKAVTNSVKSVNYYSHQKIQAAIIDVFGEWKFLSENQLDNIKIYNLNYFKFLFSFSSNGFIRSRIKYLLIFILSFNSLKKLIQKHEPDYLIIHLITSLPLFLNLLFKFKTKFILRISGMPKLNIPRYLFWKFALKKVDKITFPTKETMNYFKKLNIVNENKLFLLYDPILDIKEINIKKKEKLNDQILNSKKYFISIGRLTKQKNFVFLIDCFKEIIFKNPKVNLVIIGEGEQKKYLSDLISKFHLNNNIHLLGYKENVFKYFYNSEAFILSSLWEDPGFVIVEAIACNKLVISSDCASGPKEIISNDKGILFKSDTKTDFLKQFSKYLELSSSNKKKLILNSKKFIKKFTLLYHYKSLLNIINYNEINAKKLS